MRRGLLLLAFLALLPRAAEARKIKLEDPYGLTAILPADTDSLTKAYLMDAATRANRHLLRLEIPFELLEPEPGKFTDALEETVAMATQRGITLVGVLRGTAQWIADARSPDMRRGPLAADKYEDYREHARVLAERYPQIRYWEVWSGADDPKRFAGTPAQFARLLDAAYKGLKSGNSRARVLLPAPTAPTAAAFAPGSFLDQVLNDANYPCRKRFDAAALRLRLPMSDLADAVKDARLYLDSERRKDAAIWVVDLGFPASQAPQKLIDAGFASGEPGQASYYDRALPLLLHAGAQAVLVPLDDLPWSDPRCSRAAFPLSACSEGLVTFPDPSSPKGSKERQALAVISGM
jgi:hypothetical protein